MSTCGAGFWVQSRGQQSRRGGHASLGSRVARGTRRSSRSSRRASLRSGRRSGQSLECQVGSLQSVARLPVRVLLNVTGSWGWARAGLGSRGAGLSRGADLDRLVVLASGRRRRRSAFPAGQCGKRERVSAGLGRLAPGETRARGGERAGSSHLNNLLARRGSTWSTRPLVTCTTHRRAE